MELKLEKHLPASNRPSDILRHYLGDIIHGANDGIVSTFALISGIEGAQLDPFILIVLCFINLTVDGISVGASRFLSIRTVAEANSKNRGYIEPLRHAMTSFAAFFVFGLCPLLSFLIPDIMYSQFLISCAVTGVTLFCVGALGYLISAKHWFRSGIEMLFIGGVVSIAAYGVGLLVAELIE